METLHEIVRAADFNALASQLESGAPVDARDDNDRTPLMTIFDDESASNDAMYLEMARLLLMHGADSNAIESENGYTVLALAVQNGTLSEIELLLEAGADATYQREYGYDVLIDAMHSRTMQEKQELWPVIELLLAHGAPLNGESDWGESALSVASQRARFDVVGLLLQAGADAEILEWTPLMRAIALGSVEDMAQSSRAGADLQARDNWERTPLLLSLATGETEKAALLLEAGSDLNERAL